MNILALDIGGSKMIAALAHIQESRQESRFEIAEKVHRSFPKTYTKEYLLEQISEAIAELGAIEFDHIGVTIPGLADPANGIWVYACFSGIRDFPIAAILGQKYAKPVSIENDVNACAIAEKNFGCCRDVDNFLWMTVSNGIGGVLVLDGKIYAGKFEGAGEIGHFGVVENGLQCGCGNFGCLEAEAAGPGIAKRYLERTGNIKTAKEVADLARAGDSDAVAIFERTGHLIGRAASYAVNLLNLEKVVLGGGVSLSFDILYPSIKQTLDRHLFSSANPAVTIEQTAFQYDAGLAGAVAVAFSRLTP